MHDNWTEVVPQLKRKEVGYSATVRKREGVFRQRKSKEKRKEGGRQWLLVDNSLGHSSDHER